MGLQLIASSGDSPASPPWTATTTSQSAATTTSAATTLATVLWNRPCKIAGAGQGRHEFLVAQSVLCTDHKWPLACPRTHAGKALRAPMPSVILACQPAQRDTGNDAAASAVLPRRGSVRTECRLPARITTLQGCLVCATLPALRVHREGKCRSGAHLARGDPGRQPPPGLPLCPPPRAPVLPVLQGGGVEGRASGAPLSHAQPRVHGS